MDRGSMPGLYSQQACGFALTLFFLSLFRPNFNILRLVRSGLEQFERHGNTLLVQKEITAPSDKTLAASEAARYCFRHL